MITILLHTNHPIVSGYDDHDNDNNEDDDGTVITIIPFPLRVHDYSSLYNIYFHEHMGLHAI